MQDNNTVFIRLKIGRTITVDQKTRQLGKTSIRTKLTEDNLTFNKAYKITCTVIMKIVLCNKIELFLQKYKHM